MKNRKHAIFIAFLCSGIPMMGWLSATIVGMVTLRRGAREGFLVLLWTSLLSIVLLVSGYLKPGLIEGYWIPFVFNVLCGSVMVWMLAVFLRHYANWAFVIEVVTIFAMIGVLFVHVRYPALSAMWADKMISSMKAMVQGSNLKILTEQIDLFGKVMAQYVIGIQAAILALVVLFELMMARSWQALLYNPGGLRQELLTIRLHPMATVFLIGCCILIAVFSSVAAKIVLPVLSLPFVIAGVSLGHGILDLRKTSTSLIVLFYVLLWFIISMVPFFLLAVMMAAVVDSIFCFRKRYAQSIIKR